MTNYPIFLDWDMIFRIGIHGIWNRQSTWIFSDEEVSSKGTIRWIVAQARELYSAHDNRIISLEDIFCT